MATKDKPVRMAYNDELAKGTVEIERGSYGPFVLVDGQCLCMVDLYYQVALNQAACTGHTGLVIYTGIDGHDPLCHIRFYPDRIVFDFDSPGHLNRAQSGIDGCCLAYDRLEE